MTLFRFNDDEKVWPVHDAGLPVAVEREQVAALKAEIARRRAAGETLAGTFLFKSDTESAAANAGEAAA